MNPADKTMNKTYSVYLYSYFYPDLNEAYQSFTYNPDLKYNPAYRNYFLSFLPAGCDHL